MIGTKLTHCSLAVLLSIVVIDGDTIRIDGETIRIIGLDTPETMFAQCDAERRLGYLAKERLSELLSKAEIRVQRVGKGKYRRTLARVYADGKDVSDELIREGYARAYDGGKRKSWCVKD